MQLERLAYWAVWLLAFTIPWERAVAVPGVGAFARLLGVAALGLGLLALLQGGRLRKPSALLLGMIAFVCWVALSQHWSAERAAAVVRTETFVQLLVMVWLFWQLVRTTRDHYSLMQAYVLGAWVAAGWMLIAFATGDQQGRYTLAESNPNWNALAIAIAIPMAWHLTLVARRRLAVAVNLCFIPAGVFAIALTASRGGFLVALLALSAIPLTYPSLPRGRKLALILLSPVALVAVVSLTPEASVERLSRAQDEIREGSFSSRGVIWDAGLESIREHPMRGRGAGNFGRATEDSFGHPRSAHNAYISVAVELGLPGLILFLALLASAVLPLATLKGPERVAYAVLWATLLAALIPANWEYHKATWFVLALFASRRAFVLHQTHAERHGAMPPAASAARFAAP
jgi:hypothetical protein